MKQFITAIDQGIYWNRKIYSVDFHEIYNWQLSEGKRYQNTKKLFFIQKYFQ